jgi:hypothetical protein
MLPRIINCLRGTLHTTCEDASAIGVQVREGARLLTVLLSEGLVDQRELERLSGPLVEVCLEAFEMCSAYTSPCVALSELMHVLLADGAGSKSALAKAQEMGLIETMQRICSQHEMLGLVDSNDRSMDDLVACIAYSVLN